MALIRWEPFADIERLFDERFPNLSFANTSWDLAADVTEDNGSVTVEMNIPGIEPDDIKVHAEETYVRVSGSREEKEEQKEKHYYSKEIKRGSFERTIQLPVAISPNEVKADYKNGTLTIRAPKKERDEKGVNVAVESKE